MITIIANPLVPADGASLWRSPYYRVPVGIARHLPERFERHQPEVIPLLAEHERCAPVLGQVIHLELRRDGGLAAVALAEEDPTEFGSYLSTDVVSDHYRGSFDRHNIRLEHVAVVPATAFIGAPRYHVLGGDVRERVPALSRRTWDLGPLLTRARESWRNRGGSLTIVDEPIHPEVARLHAIEQRHHASLPLEYRGGGRVLSVR